MPITRSVFKKMQQNEQNEQNEPNDQNRTPNNVAYYPRVRFNLGNNNHKIDFVDASIEWRKNKLKKENCCFEYI
jgi:hypothetical protein